MNTCEGEMFGHQFAYTGANCDVCGVSQAALSGGGFKRVPPPTSNPFAASRFERPKPKPVRGIHSEIHALVAEARTLFGETATKGKGSFGFYIGFFSRLGALRVRQLLSESKEAADPKRAFWWKVGDEARRRKADTLSTETH